MQSIQLGRAQSIKPSLYLPKIYPPLEPDCIVSMPLHLRLVILEGVVREGLLGLVLVGVLEVVCCYIANQDGKGRVKCEC